MDEDVRDRAKEQAEVNALFNALKHDSDAQVGAIMGPLMGENPDLREYGDEVAGVIAPVVERVNEMDRETQRERLTELAPDRIEELDADDDSDDDPLGDLPDVDDYDEVRMRVAPNPNGPWHIGHARMAAVIGTYAERYDGSFICRFDDTDPETKRPDLDAYDAILDAIEYLGFEPDDVLLASDRLEIYYDHARELIDKGGAYTCSCPAEEFSDLKNAGEACPHRDKDTETVHEEFDRLVDGEYGEGEMVLRVKTDIEHKNPALRDWVAFRVIETHHPREEARDYRCWPMLDFQSGIDDHLTGVTHIIRGIDLQDSAKRQQFVYDYFDWEYPEVVHWGHVQVKGYEVSLSMSTDAVADLLADGKISDGVHIGAAEDPVSAAELEDRLDAGELDDPVQFESYEVPMSTSTIKRLVEDGALDGWDDPRAPTIASLRRRGIRGGAVVDAMRELGTSSSNVDLSMSSLYAANRDIVDDETDRAFLVRDDSDHGGGAVEKQVVGGPETGQRPVHPDHEGRGTREIPVSGSVLLESEDVPGRDEQVWLMGYGCVRHTRDSLQFVGDDAEIRQNDDVDLVHWVPADGAVETRLRTPNGDVSGYAEPGVADYDADDLLQFERVGFARIDNPASGTESLVAYFAHP